MKFKYFLLILLLVGSDIAAKITFRNDTEAKLKLFNEYDVVITARRYKIHADEYKLDPQGTITIEDFNKNKMVQFYVVAPTENRGGKARLDDKGEEYLAIIKNPKINLVVPITYDAQSGFFIFNFPADVAALKRVLKEPIEAHHKVAHVATQAELPEGAQLPSGVQRIIGELSMDPELYEAGEGLKEMARAKE